MSQPLPSTLRVAGVDVGSSAIKIVMLEDVPAGVGVHVFESRYQCDDEQPVYYELRWHAPDAALVASEPGRHLHPLHRNWDCGE